ncbi:MAG: SAM-dependent chlorinase/fluorinase [Deltaproteobacteria bacterium]|nr:SAM-dependent chlorinase/fluorinase [Deltaproteobacteria bacterium]
MPAGQAPIVTFLSDFGAGSGYPAQMKGAVLSRLPAAQLVDLSHEVPPFDLLAGALLLEACVPRFPPHAVHCAVVDPGVGTDRRPLCVQDRDGRRLVGPDNGLLTPFLGPGSRCWLLADRLLAPPPESATFHGRDLFAPVAAWLAGGGLPERLGPPVEDPVRLPWPEPVAGPDRLAGEVLAADPFGNLLTSIRACHLPSGPLLVEAGGMHIRTVRTYGEAAPAELVALLGSSGRLELSIREGSAAARLGAGRGFPVVVRLPGGEPFPALPRAC